MPTFVTTFKPTPFGFFDDDLVFQSDLLKKELEYIYNIKSLILKQLYESIYELAETVIMFTSSLDNINEEYDDTNKTQNLLKKIKPIKKINEKYNIDNISNLVDSLINNIEIQIIKIGFIVTNVIYF